MKFLKGLGIIVGLIFGAGVFALPFAIVKAGIFWGSIHFLVALVLTIFFHFLYAGVIYRTPGRHRFTGYVGSVLGKSFKKIAFVVTVASYYGTLLIYTLLGGLFISNFFSGKFAFEASVIFFLIATFLLCLKLGKVAWINFYLTIPMLGFVAYLFLDSWQFIKLSNFSTSFGNFSIGGSWLLPYGVWLFSLDAFAAIPEAKEIFSGSSLKSFKRVILTSLLISALFFSLFVFSIIGVSGLQTTEDAFSGVASALGGRVVLLGSLIGLLAVFTSYLSLGIDLRNIFRYDYGQSNVRSFFLTAVPPLLLFLLGFQSFVSTLSLVGSLGLGLTGSLVIFMAYKMRLVGKWSGGIAAIAILSAVIYEIYSVLF